MPTETQPTTVRTTADQRAKLDRIAAAWGGEVRPLSRQQVFAEMIERTFAAIARSGRQKKISKKSRDEG